MKRSTAFALMAIFLLALAVRLYPLTHTLYWGSDYGEYYYISNDVLKNHRISSGYPGWGNVYPEFPGMELLDSSVALSGVNLVIAQSIIAPVLSTLGVIIVFFIGAEMFREERIGLLASAFIAVAMPHVYTTSHPIPGAIGDLLLLLCLLLFIKMGHDKRMFGLLTLAFIVLVMTHHLSTYFLLIFLTVAIFFKTSITKKIGIGDLNYELTFFAFAVFFTLLYWSATKFFGDTVMDILPGGKVSTFLVLILALAITTLFIVFRQRIRFVWKFKYPTHYTSTRGFMLLFVSILVVAFILAFFKIPGTTMKVDPLIIAMYFPFALFVSFVGYGWSFARAYKGGLDLCAWLVATIASLFVGAALAPEIIIPFRHIEYMAIPVSLIGAVGIAFFCEYWVVRSRKKDARDRRKKTAAVLALSIFIVSANIISAYPPREIMLGYYEGTSQKTMSAIIWTNDAARSNATIASDHRLSSLTFGFSGRNATWDRAPLTITGDSFAAARSEMENSWLPAGNKTINYIIIDKDVREGAQMLVWDPAEPLSQAAQAKFESSNYTVLFDNGYAQLYMVNW